MLDHASAGRQTGGMDIYKILRGPEWGALRNDKQTPGAPVDVADGFIHFSTAEQARETAAKHFAGEDGLMLAAFDTDRMGDALKWEPSRGGALFPHYHGPMMLEHVTWCQPLPLQDGVHRFPDGFA